MSKIACCINTIFFILLVLPGCINLKSVQDYSKSSITTICKFEELNYTFNDHCTDKCLMQSVSKNNIARETECNCELYAKADSVTLVLYNAISSYFGALGNLADNEVTNYNFDPLKKALAEDSTAANSKIIEITAEQVTSYTEIASLLLRATTNGYRKKKLKTFVAEGNEPIKVLVGGFHQILMKNLAGELNFKKERLHKFYSEIVLDENSSIYERRKATQEYYQEIDRINSKQKQIEALSKCLLKVLQGHEALAKLNLSKKDLNELLNPVIADIRTLIAEFNKFKKSES